MNSPVAWPQTGARTLQEATSQALAGALEALEATRLGSSSMACAMPMVAQTRAVKMAIGIKLVARCRTRMAVVM